LRLSTNWDNHGTLFSRSIFLPPPGSGRSHPPRRGAIFSIRSFPPPFFLLFSFFGLKLPRPNIFFLLLVGLSPELSVLPFSRRNAIGIDCFFHPEPPFSLFPPPNNTSDRVKNPFFEPLAARPRDYRLLPARSTPLPFSPFFRHGLWCAVLFPPTHCETG